jgi:hypothetical protein
MGHQQPSIVSPPERLLCEVKQSYISLSGELPQPAKSGRHDLAQYVGTHSGSLVIT